MQLAGTGSASAVMAATHQAHNVVAAGLATLPLRAGAGTGRPLSLTVEEIATYDVARLNQVLTEELADFSQFAISYPPAQNDVTLYRITYPSVIPEKNNRPTLASGLIAIPTGATGTLPVVSYQHGSVFARNEVPSFPEQSTETRLMVANFAGQGYMVIGADYFGKGLSEERNSYLVKPSTQQACLDLLLTAQAVSGDLGVQMGRLFLSGWSQGGWSTLVFLNRLESIGVPVTAAAVASGPPDMFAMLNRWANNWQPIDASYVAPLISILLHAMQEYYAMPGFVNAAIKPEYQQATHDLYLNIRTIEQVEPLLPTRLPDLLQDDFKAALGRGEDRFCQLLQESHGYRWRAVTPMHLYYGGIDEVTPAYIGQLPVGYQQSIGGAEVTAVDAGPTADHRGTFLFGMKEQQEWFEGMLSE